MTTVEVTATSAAPPERVWELLVDVEGWPRWSAFDEARIESGSGVGRVQAIRSGKVTGRERVTALEPPRRMTYELLSGIPLKDYRGEVLLQPVGTGTAITWRSEFRGPLPLTGGLAARRLRPVLQDLTTALAREAEVTPAG